MIKAEIEQIPESVQTKLAGIVIEITREQFRNPEIREEFQQWKQKKTDIAVSAQVLNK